MLHILVSWNVGLSCLPLDLTSLLQVASAGDSTTPQIASLCCTLANCLLSAHDQQQQRGDSSEPACVDERAQTNVRELQVTHMHTHTHTHTCTHIRTLPPPSLVHPRKTHALFLSLSLSLSHTYTLSLALTHCLCLFSTHRKLKGCQNMHTNPSSFVTARAVAAPSAHWRYLQRRLELANSKKTIFRLYKLLGS